MMNRAPLSPPSPHDLKTDAVVVGDNMSGISIAYAIAATGKKVILLGTEKPGTDGTEGVHPVDFIGRGMHGENKEQIDGYMILPDADQHTDISCDPALQKTFKLKKITSNLLSVQIVRAPVSIHDFAKFYPAKYRKGLCAVIENNGGVMLTQTYLQQVIPGGISTDKGFCIHAPNVFIASDNTLPVT